VSLFTAILEITRNRDAKSKKQEHAMQRIQVLSLYHQMLREGSKFNYNFKHYIRRRVRAGFQENKAAGAEQIPQLIQEAQSNLEMLKRQVRSLHLCPALCV
jgi:hypothetical protein